MSSGKQSSGRGAIPHRRLQPATGSAYIAAAADLVKFQSRQYSLDGRRWFGILEK